MASPDRLAWAAGLEREAGMRRIGVLAAAMLLAPCAAGAADFRIMSAAPTAASVVDLSAIQDTGAGVKAFFSYGATDKAKLAFHSTDKFFLYAAFKYAFDCPNRKVRIDYMTVYDDKFAVVDQVDAGGKWFDPDPAAPPTSEFDLYCSATPGRSPKGVKLNTDNWQTALQMARQRLLKGQKP
jgi:hypothetical protein